MFQCDIDGCGAMFHQNAGWIQHCHRVHEGVEKAALLRSRINKSNQQLQAALNEKAENGFCCVIVACPDKATINGGRVISACERDIAKRDCSGRRCALGSRLRVVHGMAGESI